MSPKSTDLKIKHIPEITTKINKLEAKIEDAKKELDDLLDFVVEELKDYLTNDKDLAETIDEVNSSVYGTHLSLDKAIDEVNSILDCKI